MMKSNLLPLIIIGATSTLLAACGQMTSPGQQGHMMNMPFGGLFMILVLVAIVVFIALILKGVTKGDRDDEGPLDILKRRYGKGEIDKSEYERMKKELTDD